MPTDRIETRDRGSSAPDRPVAGPPRGHVSVAAFVCRETERLGREVGFPVAVLAVTTDPGRHAARLSATLYGGCKPREYQDWPLCFDEGYAPPTDLAYRQLDLDPRWLGKAALPGNVALEAGRLAVTLPEGASMADLAVALRAGLTQFAFDRVTRRPDRVRHRYWSRRTVVVAPRYALVAPGDIERVVVADDLYAFHPSDLATVADILSRSLDRMASDPAGGRLMRVLAKGSRNG